MSHVKALIGKWQTQESEHRKVGGLDEYSVMEFRGTATAFNICIGDLTGHRQRRSGFRCPTKGG